jgi:hypothetical protein
MIANRIAEHLPPAARRPAGPPSSSWNRIENVRGAVEPLERLILQYPGAALASAFLMGVAIAWWIKRK